MEKVLRLAAMQRSGAFACMAALMLCFLSASAPVFAQAKRATPARRLPARRAQVVPEETLLRIVRAEDERRWDMTDLGALLSDVNASVRARAALGAGRIGDARAVPQLLSLLLSDKDAGVRAAAAFALGETEAGAAAEGLLNVVERKTPSSVAETVGVRARAVEALGKIAAAMPKTDEARVKQIGRALLIELEARGRIAANREVALLGLTAVLRARPEGAERVVALFLDSTDARLRADAANTLTRLRAKNANDQLRKLLASDTDAVVRANAARALGAAEDKGAFDLLLERALNDRDERVRVSALRSLGTLRDSRAAEPLIKRGETLLNAYRAAKTVNQTARPAELNELYELVNGLSRVLAGSANERALAFVRAFREAEMWSAPEAEIAFARIAPNQYLRERPFHQLAFRAPDSRVSWQAYAAVAQGLGEIAAVSSERAGNSVVSVQADAQLALRTMLGEATTPALAVPDVLTAIAAFKPPDRAIVMRGQLAAPDVIVRATAAGQLGELPPDPETAAALAAALPIALQRDEMNDAALAILDALAAQKSETALAAIRTALDSPDYLLRRRAAAILQSAQPDAASAEDGRIETVATRNRIGDYRRALARRSARVVATVNTDKGAFKLELLPDAAPLTVDNFVELARRGYFNNIAFHRVVPNFVIQGGDPRGDGNGGPGYQIRCEINEVPYNRGAVGMALSGKDTGGSQWFVTHSPQPHLDGGYTVFARVVEGMEIVDRIARGDRIRSINVAETRRK
ncbi:MAG TPA: peptidylprolyl isomerase [Pyrinomonadaceae bacterium]|jgi:cyclophilin family peptidyl-prolyl cis-trans isomerase/HEAT repeat protein|nr:peptidylprolyl isomerase [Pyrinomonadaceae bacterium]